MKTLRSVCILAVGLALGVVVSSFSTERVAQRMQMTPDEPLEISQDLVYTGDRASISYYRNSRAVMEASAGLLHGDSWGCAWLSRGVEIQSVRKQGQMVQARSNIGLVGPTGSGAAILSGSVEVDDTGSRIYGDVALIVGDRMEVRGEPFARSVSEDDRELTAARLVLSDGAVQAEGDVLAEIGDVGSTSWIQSDAASIAEDGSVFYGSARMWSETFQISAGSIARRGAESIFSGSVRVDSREGEIVAQIDAESLVVTDDGRREFSAAWLRSEAVEAVCGRLIIESVQDPPQYDCSGGADVSWVGGQVDQVKAQRVRIDGDVAEAWGDPATAIKDGDLVSAAYLRWDLKTGKAVAQ